MSSSAPAMAAASNLPAQPSRQEVGSALRGVSSRVATCGGGMQGVATTQVTFAMSGRVQSVMVSGVDPSVQSCVARAVRSAMVSPFSGSLPPVTFPYRVR